MILETILALTPADYTYLAKAIQVEAATGTMDEYCVAVSILNRVRSPKFQILWQELYMLLDNMRE